MPLTTPEALAEARNALADPKCPDDLRRPLQEAVDTDDRDLAVLCLVGYWVEQ